MLDKKQVEETLVEVLFSILDIDINENVLKTTYDNLGVDSLQIVCLYCELENKLNLDLKLDEVNLFELKTPMDTIMFIVSRNNNHE